MKTTALILLALTTFCYGYPAKKVWEAILSPSFELIGGIDQSKPKDANGMVLVRAGPVSVSAARDDKGMLAGGLGLVETGEISLGLFGKINVRATSTIDGIYSALMDTEVYTGSRSFNPLTLSVTKKNNGIEYSGATDLGYLGGTYIGSTASNVIPKFEVHLNTNGWVNGIAEGSIQKGKVIMNSYNAGVDVGLLSATMAMDGDRQVLNYEVGASLGLIHGSMKIDRTKKNEKSYKAGISLGVLNVDTQILPNGKRNYATLVDAGMLRVAYNVDQTGTYGKGSIDLANLGLDYELSKFGVSVIGGRIQIGSSVIDIQRDSTGHYQVKINKGTIIE